MQDSALEGVPCGGGGHGVPLTPPGFTARTREGHLPPHPPKSSATRTQLLLWPLLSPGMQQSGTPPGLAEGR